MYRKPGTTSLPNSCPSSVVSTPGQLLSVPACMYTTGPERHVQNITAPVSNAGHLSPSVTVSTDTQSATAIVLPPSSSIPIITHHGSPKNIVIPPSPPSIAAASHHSSSTTSRRGRGRGIRRGSSMRGAKNGSSRPNNTPGNVSSPTQRPSASPPDSPLLPPHDDEPERNRATLATMCSLLGSNPDTLVREHFRREVENPLSAAHATLNALTLAEVDARFANFDRTEPPVIITDPLSTAEQIIIESAFPRLQFRFRRGSSSGHPFARAMRMAGCRFILHQFAYHATRRCNSNKFVVKDVGANISYHVGHGNYGIHCCAPILSERDSARHSASVNAAIMSLRDQSPHVVNLARAYLACVDTYTGGGVNDVRGKKAFCFNRSQRCNTRAKYIMFLHSTYDMSASDIAHTMESAGATMAKGIIIFDPIILSKDSGIIPTLNVKFDRYVDQFRVKRIRFTFLADPDLSYDHRLDTYLAILQNLVISTEKTSYHIVIDTLVTGHLFFTIHKSYFAFKPDTTERLHRSFLDLTGEKYYTIDTWDWVVETRGPSTSCGVDHMRRVRVIAPAMLYNNLFGYLLSCPPTKFTVEQALSVANNFNTRVVLNGQDVAVPERLDPISVSRLAHAIYFLVYRQRFADGKVLQTLMREEDRTRAMGDTNIFFAQLCRLAYWCLDPARSDGRPGDAPFDESNESWAQSLMRKLVYKRKYDVTVENTVTVCELQYDIKTVYGDSTNLSEYFFSPETAGDMNSDNPAKPSTPAKVNGTDLQADDSTSEASYATAATQVPRRTTPAQLRECAFDLYADVRRAAGGVQGGTPASSIIVPPIRLLTPPAGHDGTGWSDTPTPIAVAGAPVSDITPIVTETCCGGHLFEILPISGEDLRCCARAIAVAAGLEDVEGYVKRMPPFNPPGTAEELIAHSLELGISICVHLPEMKRYQQFVHPHPKSIAHVLLEREHYSAASALRNSVALDEEPEDDRVDHIIRSIPEGNITRYKELVDVIPYEANVAQRRALHVASELRDALNLTSCMFYGDVDFAAGLRDAGVDIVPNARHFVFAPHYERGTIIDDINREYLNVAERIASAEIVVARLSARKALIPIIAAIMRRDNVVLVPYATRPLSLEFFLVARGARGSVTTATNLIRTVYAMRNNIARFFRDYYESSREPRIDRNYTAPQRVLPPTPQLGVHADLRDVVDDYRAYLHRRIEVGDKNIRDLWRLYSANVTAAPAHLGAVMRRASENAAFVSATKTDDGRTVIKFHNQPKSRSESYTHFFDGTRYRPWSSLHNVEYGLVSDYTAMYIDIPTLQRLELSKDFSLNNIEVDFRNGVPGCGKTTYLLRNFTLDEKTAYLTSTRAGRDDVRERIRKRIREEHGRGPTESEARCISRSVRTFGSLHLDDAQPQFETLLLDEVLMQHPGIVISLMDQSRCRRVVAVGDIQQIPFTSRVEGAVVKYSSLRDVIAPTGTLNITYRCPVDIAATWSAAYTAATNTGVPPFLSASRAPCPSVRLARIDSVATVPPNADHYLTFMQSEKADLITAGFKPVNTIHEFQGNQAKYICLVRLRDKDTDTIYNSVPHALVAMTRHTENFVYATVYRGDDVVTLRIRMALSYTANQLAAFSTHVEGGGEYYDSLIPHIVSGVPSQRLPVMRTPADVRLPGDRQITTVEVRTLALRRPVVADAPSTDIGADNIRRLAHAMKRQGFQLSVARPIDRPRAECDAIAAAATMAAPYHTTLVTRWDRERVSNILPPALPVGEYVAAADLPQLQLVYDCLFPRTSHYSSSSLNYQSNTSDLYVNVDGVRKFSALHYVYSDRTYDTAEPVLRTCAPVARVPTLRETLHAVVKRNMAVADGLGIVCESELAKECWRLFVRDFIVDARLLEAFRGAPIGVNEQSVADWLDGQTFSDPGVIVLDQPLHDTPLNTYQMSVKTVPKVDLSTQIAFKHAPTQTILFHSKDINAVYSPIFREIKSRLLSALTNNVIFYTDMSPTELAHRIDHVSRSRHLWATGSEGDIGKYDKSQALTALLIDCELMRAFGVLEELVQLWFNAHYYTTARDYRNRLEIETAYQRKSGDASTLLGNTVFLLCVLSYLVERANARAGSTVVRLRECLVLASGDDSFIFGADCLGGASDIARDVFNLELKSLSYDSHYFCSKFVINTNSGVFVVPDPVKILVKLGRTDMRNPAHVEEFRVSLCDLARDYGHQCVVIALDGAVADRYPAYRGVSGLAANIHALITDREAFHSAFIFRPGGRYLRDVVALRD
nr:RNA-dependent RNA polymerase [Red mite virga-like virus 2]